MKKKTLIALSLIALVAVVVVIIAMGSGKKEMRFNTAVVQKEVVQTVVTATGYVQPVDKVDVGTQVSGVIEKIYVDFNSQVKKGQLLAELDKSTLNEMVAQAGAKLLSAESDLTYAQQNYDRTKQLFDSKAATQTAYEQVTNALAQSKTNVANAKANLQQADVNLSYADIYSPINGVVLNRAVDQGQTVAASFNTPTLFTIANDLKKMQVEADVDEADIGQVRLGQKVTFTVDSYSDDTFDGTVSQIRLQPTVTNNVVTYTVIIEAPNPDEKLFPGMTASVTIVTRSEEGLAITAEALNFRPTEEMLAHSKGKPAPVPAPGQAPTGKQRGVWLQTALGLEHRDVKTGLSDGVHVLVSEGLNEGDTVVVSVSLERKAGKGGATANPLMPRPPRR
ncbi:MAG: efflux RND transporter periplasmic adaptor subunit [Prevotellaceae bacterium]|jgi:HlyD family secretion protein|nr:efflux RND transporter periplasmic adaptor subunit [Prevotellaceae bacterium]